jgi:hypothetical protein
LFSFAIDISDDDGEEASSSLALGTISIEIYAKLEALLGLLQQDTAQLVNDSDPAKTILKTIRGQVPADVEETLFPAVHLESRQLQYQRTDHRIIDRAAQAQLKEEMLQLNKLPMRSTRASATCRPRVPILSRRFWIYWQRG